MKDDSKMARHELVAHITKLEAELEGLRAKAATLQAKAEWYDHHHQGSAVLCVWCLKPAAACGHFNAARQRDAAIVLLREAKQWVLSGADAIEDLEGDDIDEECAAARAFAKDIEAQLSAFDMKAPYGG